ncbi:MAG: class I SAM-dependent methyltransferase [Candidatus Aenigmatarchaeota archaeon]|nr:MAG: class I SAM-dependent methyltransferase [Candidatus Aenigmarchaeota archaeon]
MSFTEKIYSKWMKETQLNKYEGIFVEFIVPAAAKLRFESARVLDVGSGEGWFEDFLAGKGITPRLAVGVDASPHAQKNALFVLSDGNSLPFANEAFDIVVSFDTIHLIQNIHELVRVVKPGGFLLISDFCNPETMEGKRARLLKSFAGLKLLKEGVVGDERETDYVALFMKV